MERSSPDACWGGDIVKDGVEAAPVRRDRRRRIWRSYGVPRWLLRGGRGRTGSRRSCTNDGRGGTGTSTWWCCSTRGGAARGRHRKRLLGVHGAAEIGTLEETAIIAPRGHRRERHGGLGWRKSRRVFASRDGGGRVAAETPALAVQGRCGGGVW
ncbi:uncharacterized protein M6B38_102995 [Iris pallida]|uniref:Uncharacterized protein n=1 Tax=Iris pallida TaxID=29817 RepID=A0AAX6G6G1_IRIPA|nr:uncharacterized protein M6B38_102995 [Iris pallida]